MIYIDEYCKNLIRKKNKQEEQILQRLIQHGNMPVLDKYKGCLSSLQEMIVKIIYIAGQPLFLKDIKLMLVTSAEESVIDKNIKKLVEMGYLLRITSDFGLAFALSKEALSIIEEYDDMPTAKMLTEQNFYGELSKRYRRATNEEIALGKEQLMIRLTSEVAGKDLSDFFKSWGIIPTEETKLYLEYSLLENMKIN